jgi:hypothetical protein
MPPTYVRYQLQQGFVGNWLVAGPQAIAVDLGELPGGPDAALTAEHADQVLERYWHEDSGIADTPVERGPLDAGRFQIGGYTGSWSYWRCPEDHFVDQSGDYPTCHYLRSWAYVEAVSKTAKTVVLALTTYGAATVWVGRRRQRPACRVEHAGAAQVSGPPGVPGTPGTTWAPGAPPVTTPFTAQLKKGATPILVRFESVGRRQTPHAVALRICRAGAPAAGELEPAEGVHVRFRTLMPHVGRRNAFETLSAAVYLDRDVYEGETAIRLRWPEGPRGVCPAHVRLQSADGSIYALADVAGAPGDELQLGSALQLPAGPLQARLMPSPDEVYLRNLRIVHDIPLWSMGRQRYSGAPGDVDDPAARRASAFVAAAAVECSPWAQLARIAHGAWAEVDSAALLRAIEGVACREDGSNLALLGLLGMLYRWGEQAQFPQDVRQPLDDCIADFRYWRDDPGRDVMDFGPESDRLLFHACEVLAGQRWPQRVFADGRTGEWHRARGERLAREWMVTFGRYGSADWGSPDAIEREVVALSHLCDLAEDQQVYELAAVSLDKLLFLLALHAPQGVLGTACRSGRASFVKSGLLQPTAGITRLLWGAGVFNHHVAGALSLACAASYELPPIIAAIAGDAPAALLSRERHAPPGVDAADLVMYRTPEYALSSAQDYLAGHPGTRELAWQATLGAQAVVFASHPGSSSEIDSRCPGFWSGNARLPRVAQWQDVLLAVHRLPADDLFGFTHAYFPTACFDEYVLRDGWAFARAGDGYLALTNSQGIGLTGEGRYAGRELRAHGAQQTWLVQLGRAARDGNFAAFQAQVLARAPVFEERTVRYATLAGDRLAFGWEGPLTVNGEAQPLHGTKHLENAYATAELPGDQLEIRRGGDGLRLDFAEAAPQQAPSATQ